MRSSSHFQFGEESSSGCAQQNLCKVTGKSGAQKTVIVIGLESERSAIENRELRIENRRSMCGRTKSSPNSNSAIVVGVCRTRNTG